MCDETLTGRVSRAPCVHPGWNNDCRLAWAVTQWGSHPDEGNDDCWTGEDFNTEAEARACVERYLVNRSVQFVMLEGPRDEREVTRNKSAKVVRDDGDDEWRRENAMQAGMAFGCDGYNDAMGYS